MKRVGYCCINLSIPSKFRTTTVSWCQRNPDLFKNKLLDIYDHNFSELSKVIEWNILNNIWLYRISSDLNPLHDHPLGEYLFPAWAESLPASLVAAKNSVKKYLDLGGRLVIHPSQYCSIGSERESVRLATIYNLSYHGTLFDLLGIPSNRFGLINIHLSGGKDPLPRIHFYYETLAALPESVTNRLTFETEHSGFWGAKNILKYFPDFPIVFDTLHHKCNSHNLPDDEAYSICESTWHGLENIPQLIHHSEGKSHPLDKSHSDYVENLPNYPADVEIEAKAKDLAVLKMFDKYGNP